MTKKTIENQKKLTKETVVLLADSIVPYKFNNKKHPKKQIDTIKNSILECGYLSDILVDENNVILAGHGRYIALQELGYEEIQVQKVLGLSEVQKKKYRILDNVSSELAEYDKENLQIELQEIGDVELSKMVCELASIEMPDPNSLNTDFSLPSSSKGNLTQMTFTVATEQKNTIDEAIDLVKETDLYKSQMNFGNENSNGNALSCIIEQWLTQNK